MRYDNTELEQMEDDFDQMEEYEEELEQLPECQNEKYYFSTVIYPEKGQFIMDFRINMKLFFKYDYRVVLCYSQLPIDPNHRLFGELEIVKLYIKNDVYNVVIKTFWVRLIQRTWKRIFRERQKWLTDVKKNILSFVTNPKVKQFKPYPTLDGSLSYLSNVNKYKN